ncbi:Gldg family protein [Candidatus Poribacteria bacterium]|nr:Gldg family protein [Candidatus Poribacteria bacterium]
MQRKLFSWFGLIIALALLLAVNILSNALFRSSRVDLTDKKLYTLSEGTKNILGNLTEPISIKYYYSAKLAAKTPAIKTYGTRVQEMLEEYRDVAKGKIELSVIDPEPFSVEEDDAALAGLQGVPVGAAGDNIFLGLVAKNSVDDAKQVPFFQPDRERFLEYDLSRMISDLSSPKKKVLGIISPLPVLGKESAFDVLKSQAEVEQPWIVMGELQKLYEVKNLDLAVREIPEDVELLLLVHPKGLADQALYAIDQYVLRGGRAIVFVDPYCEADQPEFNEQQPYERLWADRSSTLGPLMKTWGIEMATDKFAADRGNPARVTTRNSQGMLQQVDYVAWLNLGPDNYNKDEVSTASIDRLRFATAGALKPIADATTKIEPLIKTSSKSMELPIDDIRYGQDPRTLLEKFKDSGQEMILAARISGPAKTAYPDGPPAAEGEEKPDASGQLKESREDINVIMVGDADILTDRLWVEVQNFLGQRVGYPVASNGDFFYNIIEQYFGSNDLIKIRSRGTYSRPFDLVAEIAREAEEKYRERESELQKSLEETQERINTLQSAKGDASQALILSDEQRAEVDKLRTTMVETRKELRAVRHDLEKDIEGLGTRLKLLNIGLIPSLVSVFAVILGLVQVRRRRA